jgi:hypothetical protein
VQCSAVQCSAVLRGLLTSQYESEVDVHYVAVIVYKDVRVVTILHLQHIRHGRQAGQWRLSAVRCTGEMTTPEQEGVDAIFVCYILSDRQTDQIDRCPPAVST